MENARHLTAPKPSHRTPRRKKPAGANAFRANVLEGPDSAGLRVAMVAPIEALRVA